MTIEERIRKIRHDSDSQFGASIIDIEVLIDELIRLQNRCDTVRTKPASRLLNETVTLTTPKFDINLSVSLDPLTYSPVKISISTGKLGSTMEVMLEDISALITVALQHHVPLQHMLDVSAKMPDVDLRPEDLADFDQKTRTRPASIVGLVLAWLVEYEKAQSGEELANALSASIKTDGL